MRKHYMSYHINNYVEWGEYWNHAWDNNILNMIRVFNENSYRGYGSQYDDIELYLFY